MMESIKSRFAVSFFANLVRGGLTFVTAIFLARWLGPTDFGKMSFLLGVFMAVRGFLDMGSSQAFFTLLSRRPRTRRFIAIFWGFIAIQLIVGLLLLFVLLPDSLMLALWSEESRVLLVLAFVATFMQGTVWTLAANMAEASRETIRAQKINTAVVVMHLVVVAVLALMGELAVPLVLAALVVEWSVAAWFASRLYVTQVDVVSTQNVDRDTPGSVFREIYVYCLPLLPTTIFVFAHDFADRWMLQRWAGATEQAYFSVAQQYSSVALLATASMLRILWKEIAEAHHLKNMQRVGMLYQRASRQLFFVGAFLAGGLQPLASELLNLTVGQAYVSGTLTMLIMLLYPVHQSMGQIGGTMMFATGHTKVYAMCTCVSILLGLVLAYFMLAPADAPVPGLHLGAEGLALKLVGVQIFSVNLLGWMIARIFGWRFDWNYQIFALAGCLGFGWLSHYFISLCFGETGTLWISLSLQAFIYTGLIGFYLYFSPWLVSLTREEYVMFLEKLRRLAAIK